MANQIQLTDAQYAFFAKFIGAPRLTAKDLPDGNAMPTLWRDAKEGVDGGLSQLRQKFLDTGDPEFAQLAEMGIFAIGKTENVALMKAFAEYRAASQDAQAKAATNVTVAAIQYRDMLATSELVQVLDENPFGVDLRIRETLGSALGEIISTLR